MPFLCIFLLPSTCTVDYTVLDLYISCIRTHSWLAVVNINVYSATLDGHRESRRWAYGESKWSSTRINVYLYTVHQKFLETLPIWRHSEEIRGKIRYWLPSGRYPTESSIRALYLLKAKEESRKKRKERKFFWNISRFLYTGQCPQERYKAINIMHLKNK